MGKLFFDLLKVKRLSADYYFVIGKWFLKRKAGDIGGIYTLLFRKINGQVADRCRSYQLRTGRSFNQPCGNFFLQVRRRNQKYKTPLPAKNR